MKIVNIHEAKTKLSALLAEVEAKGEKILVCRHGKPIADLVLHRKSNRLELHSVMRKIRIDYDLTEPLAKDEWPESSW